LALLLVIAIFGLSVAGLAVHGLVGGALLLVVAAVLVTLSVGTWGQLRRQGRPVRILIAGALVVIAVLKIAGKL
jgi:hypothetical protein